MNTYKEYYQENVVPGLMDRFKFKSNMEAPRLIKITLNMGLGSAIADKKILERAQEELTQIAGQKAVLTYAKKSIANFKLREGMPIGCKVTLRGQMMYDFFEKLIGIAKAKIFPNNEPERIESPIIIVIPLIASTIDIKEIKEIFSLRKK